MIYYRTRVELGSTGYVAYHGHNAQLAFEALLAAQPRHGEHAVCERRNGGPDWEQVVRWDGGRPMVCPRCGGTGDSPKSLNACVGCKGTGLRP